MSSDDERTGSSEEEEEEEVGGYFVFYIKNIEEDVILGDQITMYMSGILADTVVSDFNYTMKCGERPYRMSFHKKGDISK